MRNKGCKDFPKEVINKTIDSILSLKATHNKIAAIRHVCKDTGILYHTVYQWCRKDDRYTLAKFKPYDKRREYDDLLIDCIKQSPHNLSLAFENTANIIGDNKMSVERYYYRKIRKTTHILSLSTNEGIAPSNVKNEFRSSDNTVSKLSAVNSLYDNIMNLSVTDRKKLISKLIK